ncbi:MAG: hypothetical protein U5K51_07480 [Flavobacteriaceae bacterium]|nr:hypothetical protein [Flavobacteriaceae bacterium]
MNLNLIELTHLLQNPNRIDAETDAALNEMITEFPFFQAARALHLLGLKKQGSYKYNAALKKTAAYTTDRAILFNFITREEFQIVNYIAEVTDEKETVLSEVESGSSEFEKKPDEIKGTVLEEIQEVLPLGKPINFRANDQYSFNEWLMLTNFKPIERIETPETNAETGSSPLQKRKEDKFDLIEKFIANNPKIGPVDATSPEVFSDYSIQENENLMTETLAHVYLEQKKFNKAITAFQILSLKYPEKSSFFAHQIEAIKEIQKNN